MVWMSAGWAPNDVVRGISARIQRSNDLQVVAAVVDLHRIDGVRQARVVVAAPAGNLAALDCREGARVGGVHRVGAAAECVGERLVHPGLEVRPGGEIAVGAAHRRDRGLGLHVAPGGEMRAPFGVQRVQRRILRAQPGAHAGQRLGGQVEVPECRQVGNPRFVAEIIEQGVEALFLPHDRGQPGVDARLPNRVGQAGVTHQGGEVVGIGTIALLNVHEAPVHRLAWLKAMVWRVKVGGDVLDIPTQASLDQRRGLHRERLADAFLGGDHHPGGDANALQRGELRRVARLPLDDLIVGPRCRLCLHHAGEEQQQGAQGGQAGE